MNQTADSNKKNPQKTAKGPRFITALMGGGELRTEKARMEAFLSAVPMDYCGWGPDGAIAYSEGFCRLLALDSIRNIHDIQNRLSASDAAALEGMFFRLQEQGEPFSITVRTADRTRTMTLSGSRGVDSDGSMRFNILWLQDTTVQAQEQRRISEAQQFAESEQLRLQAALDHAPVPLWMRNTQTDLIWCNRAYANVLDTSPATVIAEQRELPQTARKKGPATALQPGRPLAQAALDAAQPKTTQAHIIHAGTRLLWDVTETPLPGLGLTLGSAHDRTREEELETHQRRNTAANKELLEQLGSSIAIFAADQKIEFFNSAFAQLWQLDDSWLNTQPKLGDIMEKLRETRRLPEQADFRKFKQSWLNMFTGLIGGHEDMLYLPDGRALRQLVIPHPMGGLMMIFEDVTGRLELESSYNTLVAVQKETLDNLSEGVAVFGGDGRLKLWNPAWARLWHLNPEDLDGEPHISRIVERLKPLFHETVWPQQREELIAQGLDRTQREGRLQLLNQTLVDFSTVPLPDGGVLVAHIDVTDSARVEAALRDRNEALEAAERLKLDFLANVSYQLRTPLNAITGFAEILGHEYFGPLNERQKEYTTGLQDAGKRLVSLVDDILDLSTIEAGYMQLQTSTVDVHRMLAGLVDLTTEWARKEKINVRLDCPDDIGSINADEQRMKQVLLNLIRNAINFTPEGGTITVGATRTNDGHIALHVTDTGPGIASEDRARVLEPFERGNVKGAMAARQGAGLGLTLVRNIVQLHGGTITLDSPHNHGTIVTISLPV